MSIVHSPYREAGTVTIDENTCRHCGQCANICPGDVLALEDGVLRVRDDSPFGGIACGHCMMVCPEGSVQVTGRGISSEDLVPLPPPEERASADAPALIIFHHSPYADTADAMIACTYAMLAAESLGLGNTIIGGAPLVDIKPYIPEFDVHPADRTGWFGEAGRDVKAHRLDGRFA